MGKVLDVYFPLLSDDNRPLNDVFQQSVRTQNLSYIGDLDTTLAELEQLDQQWREADASDNDLDPLVHIALTNEIALELKEYQQVFPVNVEVFITDRYGALIGSTNRTSDYYQADEGWWQAAFNDGQGSVYISDPEFDESVGEFSVLLQFQFAARKQKKF